MTVVDVVDIAYLVYATGVAIFFLIYTRKLTKSR